MSLEWQLHDTEPVPNEDCGSMLPDVAERAKEVVPVEHRSRTILPTRIAAPLFQRGYVGVTESPVRSAGTGASA